MDHIVKYEDWCKLCKHKDVDEKDDPCDSCLEQPINTDSRKPVLYEERD